MTSKSLADEMREALVAKYGEIGSLSDLLRLFYTDHPEAGKWGTQEFLAFARNTGSQGSSHASILLDFWKNRRFTPGGVAGYAGGYAGGYGG